jgi:aminoglycoside phosphotransferase (APT) family kinase protein
VNGAIDQSVLLDALRAAAGSPVAFADAPVALTGGYETTTLSFRLHTEQPDWARPLVLRMFDRGVERAAVRTESTAMRIARAGGLPVPDVVASWPTADPLGAPAILMERVAGRPLFEDLFPIGLPKLVPTLARLQAELHSLDVASVEPDEIPRYEDQLSRLRGRVEAAQLNGLLEGLAWLRDRAPASALPVLCHGDFHPFNILSEGGTPTGVIDWSLATLAEPEFDVGCTRVVLAYAPAGAGIASALIGAFQRIVLSRRYYRRYLGIRRLEDERVAYYEAYRCLRALVWAGEAALNESMRRVPWSAPEVSKRLAAHFRLRTGVSVSIQS